MMNASDFCVLTARRSRNVRLLALAIAYDAVGAAERGGQNRGPIVRSVMEGHEGTPWMWCAGFATECYEAAADMLSQPDPLATIPEMQQRSSSRLYMWAKVRERLTISPRPGDIFLVPGGRTGWKHTGICASSIKNKRIKTVEGNVKDMVVESERDITGLAFIRVVKE